LHPELHRTEKKLKALCYLNRRLFIAEEIGDSKGKNPSNISDVGVESRIARYSPRGIQRENHNIHCQYKFSISRGMLDTQDNGICGTKRIFGRGESNPRTSS
jgi:chorismate mutase